MDYWVISSIESVVFIGLFLIAIYLLIPKAVKHWQSWKKSGKSICLSNSIGCGVVAFFLLLADLLKFIQAVSSDR